MQFHISRQARDRYQFDQSIFSFNGNAILADFHAARLFAQKMNQKRDLTAFPEQSIKAGQINAMGLMDEIFHLVFMLYRKQHDPNMLESAHSWLAETLGAEDLERLLVDFAALFPPMPVYQGLQTAKEYLDGTENGVPNRFAIIEELVILWVTNKNPALSPYEELFSDQDIQPQHLYAKAISALQQFFAERPPFGPENKSLIEMLRAPAIAVPYSITGQLEYIRTRWSSLLGKYLYRLLSSLDLIKEEEKIDFMAAGFGPGPVSIPVYDRSLTELEGERFSPDREWMPRLVLIAKNSYVWLDQLSKKYQYNITRLDQIPDSELDEMAAWGMTGLWLIGLWERSRASAVIKQMCGNPEAVASAYSLFDYRIAEDLGGEEAYQNLRQRAWQRGIRLASDMVPNHMGIDSPWVVEHPEWFISLDYPPFPAYSFNGPNLSQDGRAGIYIEDHYFSRSDASVVFKRVDHQNGNVRYIYHGNDGTSMPWNDTAQLNYLNSQVREQVIQTILQVARRFPVIRFDAAMTLAKRHYQRLWFPEPGSGGDIPTRAEHGMTKADFDRAFPVEFWREVVDRVAAEVPDTLLLAEAFWLMEGYFVRTLGMHRVYNSAFMNLLRNEDNAKYRTLMKNTLEFDPEILKRYVNFMNNPDERTAVDQFGKGDKYFGICTLMATMPGLPMFGHGQVQGFTEKYGMEYRRAYYEEYPDQDLIERHRREVFPLLHRRDIFAGVDNFLLYDFFTTDGWVDENVFAYSNSHGNDHGLVVYNNRFSSTRGWIRQSTAFIDKSNPAAGLMQKTLAEGLQLSPGENRYLLFREHNSGLQYIRPVNEVIEKGVFLSLEAYKTLVFLDFQVVEDDNTHTYRQLYEWLQGSGIPSLQEAMQELVMQPVSMAVKQILNPGYFLYLDSICSRTSGTSLPEHLLPEAQEKVAALLDGIQTVTGQAENRNRIITSTLSELETLLDPDLAALQKLAAGSATLKKFIELTLSSLDLYSLPFITVWSFTFLHQLGKTFGSEGWEERTRSWLDEWRLTRVLDELYQQLGMDTGSSQRKLGLLRIIVSQQSWNLGIDDKTAGNLLQVWLEDEQVQRFIQVNRHNDILWFNQESFEELVWWMKVTAWLEVNTDAATSRTQKVEQLLAVEEVTGQMLAAMRKSEFRLAKLVELLNEPGEDQP